MKIKELRGSLTQNELSKFVNIPVKNLSNYEVGRSEPSIYNLIKLANYFNVSLDYLCDRPFNNNIGYIPDNRKDLIKLILELSDSEANNLYSYLLGKTGKEFNFYKGNNN